MFEPRERFGRQGTDAVQPQFFSAIDAGIVPLTISIL
jgi:hypothetical protein